MKRLLCITANMNAGGAETFLMKVYRNLDRDIFQMDFCVTNKENKYEDEIVKLGGRIYVIPPKSKNPIKSFYSIIKLVKKEQYKYVIRVNEHSLSTIDLIAAKLGGASCLAMRSSNSASDSKLSTVLHKMFMFLPKLVPNVKIAPSKLAAEYTFGKKEAESKVHIINNGLDIDDFSFNELSRKEIRNQLGIDDELVIGHVGRFNAQKNHSYLLDVFSEIAKRNNEAILLLVGEGILENEIKQKAIELGIIHRCIFTGVRSDVNKLLCAMDVFVFPSLYEGMPNTVIEAQTSGLKCFVSDSITKEANVNGMVTFLPIDSNPAIWSDQILNSKLDYDRLCSAEYMISSGYSISDTATKFSELIFNNTND